MNANTNFRGRWVLTPDFELRNDLYIVCAAGQVQSVTTKRPDGPIVEHDGLILPGLVNAHTHLEFSDLAGPLGEPGMDFVSWVGQVIGYRNARDSAQAINAVRHGLSESLHEGNVAIGEISTFDWHGNSYPGIDLVDFRELIGFRPAQADSLKEVATSHISAQESEGDLESGLERPWQVGLSPHAPYSINRDSFEFAVQYSAEKKIPLAMHLAETKEELELLRDHSGPFRELLNRMDLWTDSNFPLETAPLHFLQRLVLAHRSLIVHGNYLKKDELTYIAENRDVLKLVYCPRTHAYFQHDPYPLELINELGIKLALGTDSRASNPDLSIWKEMEFLFQIGKMPAIRILETGTLHGAEALGLEDSLGQLAPGKSDRLFFAPPPDRSDFSKALVDKL